MKSNQTLKWSLRTAAVFVTFVRAEAAELWSLRPEQVTIAQLLKDAGYRTAHYGKWHVGAVKRDSPTSPRELVQQMFQQLTQRQKSVENSLTGADYPNAKSRGMQEAGSNEQRMKDAPQSLHDPAAKPKREIV